MDQAQEEWYEYQLTCMAIDKSNMKIRDDSDANDNCPTCSDQMQKGEWPRLW